ncbi:MAG: hypothetical protein O2960_01295 [Verrucomicrobia bacterium]|nr:hypothetical protein [Verrucomicrobiota bacterium]
MTQISSSTVSPTRHTGNIEALDYEAAANQYHDPLYAEFFEFIEPRMPVKLEEATPYECAPARLRHPRETKGMKYNATTEPSKCCDGGNGGCC